MALDVIYGEDGRTEFYSVDESFQENTAKPTAAIFLKSDLLPALHHYSIERSSFGIEYGLCTSERFYNQTLGPRCSGVLVASNLVLTAGHCIPEGLSCKDDLLFNFDFHLEHKKAKVQSLSKLNTYGCSKVLYSIQSSFGDLALVQLDRNVRDVEPVTNFLKTENIVLEQELVMTGYPSGLPLKVTSGGKVLAIDQNSLLANVDSFGGNSGSPVFLASSGALVGILSRGEIDFIKNGSCLVSKKCNDTQCVGETISTLDNIVELIQQYRDSRVVDPVSPDPHKGRPEIYSSFKQTAIPDGDYMGISSSIRIDSLPKGRSIYVGVDISHEWVGDLKLELENPDGRKLTLTHLNASGNAQLKGVYGFDLISMEPLNKFSSVKQTGQWKLIIRDLKKGDHGVLNNWRVIFN